jgi:hypothetical protein
MVWNVYMSEGVRVVVPPRPSGRRRGAVTARGVVLAFVALVALAMTACAAQSSGAWQVLGPNDGSIVLAMIPDATVPQVVYAGTSDGQVLRTRTDSRATAPGTGLPAHAVVPALVAEPGVGGVVYAGTSDGVYVTTDYGDTWSARGIGLPRGDSVQSFAIVKTGTITLYGGTQEHGVYLSLDAGKTWTPVNEGLPAHANVYALTYDPATNTVFAALSGGPGIFALSPSGTTWTPRDTGLPAGSDVFALLPMAAHGAVPARLYAGTSQGAYVSSDGGRSWTATGLGNARVLSLAGDPTTAGTLYVYRGVDGAHWQPVAPGIQDKVAALVARSDASGRAIVFAGARNILRYPPNTPPSSTAGSALTILILLVLVALLFFFSRRSLRLLGNLTSQTRPSGGRSEQMGSPDVTHEELPRRVPEPDGASRNAQNGHDSTQLP